LYGVVKVTPEMAKSWLNDTSRPTNRGISHTYLQVVRGWLRRGEWRVTHQGFAFDKNGKLFDGAHRCTAIVAEGATVDVAITVGLDYEDVMPTLDSGKKRSLGEVLRIKGKPNHTQLGTALRWLYLCLKGPSGIKSNRTPSAFEALQALEAYPSVEFWLSQASSSKGFRRLCPSIGQFSGLCTMLQVADPGAASDFFYGVVTGANLGAGDPRLLLRDRFLRSKQAKTGMLDKLYPTQLYSYTAVAWNAHCRGAHLAFLRSPSRENLPTFDGLDWEEEGRKFRAMVEKSGK